MQRIIVDGYNVIHADPQLKKLSGSSMEKARDALVSRLATYLAERKIQITLVFDGAGGIADSEAVVPGRLQVVFSATGQTADTLIVETIRSASNPRQFIVVTSDFTDIGRAARQMGAQLISSGEFLSRLDGKRSKAEENDRAEPVVDDIDYWLDQFGERGKNK